MVWSGFGGAPGYTNMYFTPGDAGIFLPGLKGFFDLLVSRLPNGMHIAYPSSGDELNEASGVITGSWGVTPPADTVGGDSSVYPGAAGACVIWDTLSIVAGRRLKGRTFVVPMTSATFDIDGSLSAGTVTLFNSAIATFLSGTAGSGLVWHRPVGGSGGVAGVIQGGHVSDKCAVMRSRRQ